MDMREPCLMIAAILALGSAPLPSPVAAQPAPGAQTVSKAEAKCIADNVDSFLDDPDDPVVIYMDLCVPAEQLKDLVAGQVRSDLPTINPPKVVPGAENAARPKSISVPKSALRCLKTAARAQGFPASDPFALVSRCD